MAKKKSEFSRLADMKKSIESELWYLNCCSIRWHGRQYVEFSPEYRDYQSKRRVRLNRTYFGIIQKQSRLLN